MKNNSETTLRVEAALNSLDGISPATANPFLYGKIQHRLSLRSSEAAEGKWFFRLAYALAVVLVMNIYSYSSFLSQKPETKAGQGIEAFAKELGMKNGGDNI